jgi:hypothetical protein
VVQLHKIFNEVSINPCLLSIRKLTFAVGSWDCLYDHASQKTAVW